MLIQGYQAYSVESAMHQHPCPRLTPCAGQAAEPDGTSRVSAGTEYDLFPLEANIVMSRSSTNPGPGSRTDLLALLALCLWACAQLAWWLSHDRLNPLWDEAGYLNRALDAAEALRDGGWRELVGLYFQTLGPRPTFAFVSLAQPVLLLFGPELDLVIFITNAPIFCLVLCGTFWLGRWAFDSRAGLLSAFLVACLPQINRLATVYWPHFSVVAVTVVGTCLLLASDRLRRPAPALAFGLLLGLGLMFRPVYPALFLFGPALLTCLGALRGGPEVVWPSDWSRRARMIFARAVDPCLRVMGPAMILTFVIAGPFYASIWGKMTNFISRVGEEQAVAWPERSSFFYYLEDLPNDASWAFVALLVVGVGASLRYRSRSALWLIAAFAISFFPVSWSDNRAFYYFAPAYPLMAVLATGWLSLLESSVLRRGLTGLVLGLGIVLYTTTNWAPGVIPPPFEGLLTAEVRNSPHKTDWGLTEVADRIAEDWHETARGRAESELPLVGLAAPSKIYSLETFHFFARQAGHSFEHVSNGRVLSSLLETDYLVLRFERTKQSGNSALGSWITQTAAANLSTGLPGFRQIERWKANQNGKLVLFRRPRPATLKDLLRWVELLGRTNPDLAARKLAAEYRTQKLRAAERSCLAIGLGHLSLRADDLEGAEIWYRRAAERPAKAARCWARSLRPPDAPRFRADQRLFLRRIEASLGFPEPDQPAADTEPRSPLP